MSSFDSSAPMSGDEPDNDVLASVGPGLEGDLIAGTQKPIINAPAVGFCFDWPTHIAALQESRGQSTASRS